MHERGAVPERQFRVEHGGQRLVIHADQLGGRQETKGQATGLPPASARHPATAATDMVTTETLICQHRCNDPLNPRAYRVRCG